MMKCMDIVNKTAVAALLSFFLLSGQASAGTVNGKDVTKYEPPALLPYKAGNAVIAKQSGPSERMGVKKKRPLYREGEYIVTVKRGYEKSGVKSVLAEKGVDVKKKFAAVSKITGRDYFFVKSDMSQKSMAALQSDPAVISVTPNYMKYTCAETPDDALFKQQWCHRNQGSPYSDMDSPAAWQTQKGSRDVVVAVLDTGVDYTHPDLKANMWINPGETAGNGIDDDGNGYVDDVYGPDTGNDDSDPMDYHGHGTHCAGIIAAEGDNGIGVCGVNWRAKVMAVKGFDEDEDGMSTVSEVEALNYILDMKMNRGVNIIAVNASFGFTGEEDTAEKEAIEALGEAGILFMAAAGNSGTNNDSNTSGSHYPSSYDLDNIISVASWESTDELSDFSCYGKTSVDLAAPGGEILSTVMGSYWYTPNTGADIFFDDMESGGGNWTADGNWAITEEASASPTHAWSDSPGGIYGANTDFEVVSRVFNLSGADGPLSVGFKAKHELEESGNYYFDSLEVWFMAPPEPGVPQGVSIVPEKWQITDEKSASGNMAWSDSPGGNYGAQTEQWLLTPVYDLSGSGEGTEFRFKLTGETEAKYDSLVIRFSGDSGATWSEEILSIDGNRSGQWYSYSAAIPESYRTETFMASFTLETDGSVFKDGYYIDDVEIADGEEVLFSEDMENGVGNWREPGTAAVPAKEAQWEKAGEIAGSSDGEWRPYNAFIDEAYFWEGFQFKFVLHADYSIQKDGVYIDDVGVGVPEKEFNYESWSGTSMATPQVTGAAALMAAQFPGITAGELKAGILGGTVPKESLKYKTVTGGILNLKGALSDPAKDTDNDGIPDFRDNCPATANADQRDTDSDGSGNICDCDLNNNDTVEQSDFMIFRNAWGSDNPEADFNGDDIVNQSDLMIFRSRWGSVAPFE